MLNTKISSMQTQMDQIKFGHCILIKLINYDELASLYSDAANIVYDLHQIVRRVCYDAELTIYSQIEHEKIFIILQDVTNSFLKEFIYKIYSVCQLYTNDQFPEAYMDCKIASIDFTVHKNDARQIYTLLAGLVLCDHNPGYYYKYSSDVDNIAIIKDANEKLNLLRKALQHNAVQFAYQPIVDGKTGQVSYHECLLRIQDASGGFISVGPIIQAAESKGLIYVIDQVVLKMAVAELAQSPDITLSVNISNIGILDDYLLDVATELLKRHDIYGRLIIEITETSLNEDYNKSRNFIDTLHKLGCRFALDDFGSGFTSFKQLQKLPIDIIKIDGSYVRNLMNDPYSKYFVEALVKASEELGIKTVAEFVENGKIAKFLIDIKIDGMQGDFFAPASSKREAFR